MFNQHCLDNIRLTVRAPPLGVLLPVLLAAACGTETTNPEEPPTIDAVTPSLGALAGTDAIEITGTNFSDVVGIAVGGRVPRPARRVSATTIRPGPSPASCRTRARWRAECG